MEAGPDLHLRRVWLTKVTLPPGRQPNLRFAWRGVGAGGGGCLCNVDEDEQSFRKLCSATEEMRNI